MSKASAADQHVNKLVGARCWSVIGDEHADVHIGLGGRVRRDRPLANVTLSDEERIWRPELDILIHCSWRLQSADTILAGALDGGAVLKVLIGHTVESVDVRQPAWDLVLRFSGGLALVVFADETRAGYENFSVGVRGAYWAVHAKALTSWQ